MREEREEREERGKRREMRERIEGEKGERGERGERIERKEERRERRGERGYSARPCHMSDHMSDVGTHAAGHWPLLARPPRLPVDRGSHSSTSQLNLSRFGSLKL